MTRRKNDPEGNRNKIVLAAFELFTTQGFGDTSMQDVRDRALVSSGALAHHFPAKHDLGLAVIREPLAAAIEETWVDPVRGADNVAAGVSAVFEATIEQADRTARVNGCPLGNLAAELSTRDEVFRNEINMLYQRWRNAIAARLSADAVGHACAQDSEQLADFVVATFSGAILMAKAGQNSAPLKSSWSQLKPLLRSAGAQVD